MDSKLKEKSNKIRISSRRPLRLLQLPPQNLMANVKENRK